MWHRIGGICWDARKFAVCEDVFRVSKNRDPIDREGPCESGCVWLEGDTGRDRVGHEKMKERQKGTCVVDLKDDRETCK